MGVINRSIKAAVRLYNEGMPDAAEEVCRGILKVEPGNAEVLHLLAQFDCRVGRAARAVLPARQAVALEPARANYQLTLGFATRAAAATAAAIACYSRAIVLDEQYAEAYLNLGTLLPIRGARTRACWRRAVLLQPELAEAHNNLAGACLAAARLDEAALRYGRALSLLPTYAEAWNGLSSAGGGRGTLHAALLAARRALMLAPAYAEAMNNHGTVLVGAGEVAAAAAWLARAVATSRSYADAGSNLLFALAYDATITAEALFAAQRAWARRHMPEGLPVLTARARRDPERRLRVGYLSADFREHPIAWNLRGLIENHDRRHFETCLYSAVVAPDQTTESLRSLADRWSEVADLAPATLARRVSEDGIDILVILAAHTAGNRPTALAYRPAPIQVAFHGIGSTGLDAVDYWLTDAILHPPDTAERFTEELVRLPCFYLHAPPGISVEPDRQPAMATGAITFGSCNNPAKLSDQTIEVWAELLRQVPNSRLLLKYVDRFRDPYIAQRILDAFARRGVGAAQLILAGGHLDRRQQLALLNGMDIALDPFPFNGSTTSFEALWMGVPVVTKRGERFVGRVGASLLEQVGLGELVAGDDAEYTAIAARLAGDASRLSSLRGTLRARVLASPLCDARNHARSIEAAYRTMWRRWCAQP